MSGRRPAGAGGEHWMHEGIIAMLVIIAVLVIRDMAKTVLSGRKDRNLSEIYEHHPQKERMEKYAESFQKLANSFYNMPVRKDQLTAPEIEEIFDKMQEGVCSRCQKADSCWNLCFHLTYQQGCELLKALEEGEQEEIARVFGDWTQHCINGARFLEEIRGQFARARQDLLWNNRLIENRLAVAEQLGEVAHIMQMAAEDIYSITGVPHELEEQARKTLRKLLYKGIVFFLDRIYEPIYKRFTGHDFKHNSYYCYAATSGIWYNSKFKERFVSRFVKSLDEWSKGNDDKTIELFEPNIAPLVIDDKESWGKCEENLFDWLYWYTQKVEGNSVYSPLEALTLYEWYKYMYNSK